MAILEIFVNDPILFPALIVLIGTGWNGTINYPEGETPDEETETEFDPDKF